MTYIYNVIYYRDNSLFHVSEYENEYFSSMKTAQQFLSTIVQEENRDISEHDFYYWKIKLIVANLDALEEKREFIYDLSGKLLFDSENNCNHTYATISNIESIGTIVKVEPFPWNIHTNISIPKYGVIGEYFNEEYIVYMYDNFRLVHAHQSHQGLSFPVTEKEVEEEILLLSKILKKEIVVDEAMRIKFLDGDIKLDNLDLIKKIIS